jgi:hypothetical protein
MFLFQKTMIMILYLGCKRLAFLKIKSLIEIRLMYEKLYIFNIHDLKSLELSLTHESITVVYAIKPSITS